MLITHIGVAGLIGLFTYIAVIHFVISYDSTWNLFNNEDCSTPLSRAFCVIAGLVRILFKNFTIALPLSILFSGLYMKIVKLSLAASILVPVCANILALFAIILIGQHFDDIPMKVLAALIPLTYLVVGLPGAKR